jgi:hypothetical protein
MQSNIQQFSALNSQASVPCQWLATAIFKVKGPYLMSPPTTGHTDVQTNAIAFSLQANYTD